MASASKTKVAVGEQFQLSFTASGNANLNSYKAPNVSGLTVLMGPSTSSSVQIINGNMSQQIAITYIVVAEKEGVCSISSASVIINGKRIESNPLKIEVTKNPINDGKQNGNNSQSSNSFVSTVVSQSKIYLGQQFTVTHKVYSRDQIVGFKDIEFPNYESFWSQVIDNKRQNIQLSIEVIEGVEYYCAEMRQAVLFPQKTGKIEILPVNVDMVVKQPSNKKPTTIFEQFFGTSYKEVELKVKGKPITIEVVTLPENNKPLNYKNYIGNFSCSTKLNKENAKTNEAVTLSITISGKGNLKMIEAPEINLPAEVEKYDPKVNERITINSSGMSGSKTFEYTLIPRASGKHNVKIEPLIFYDYDKKQYITIPSPEYELNIEKGANDEKNLVLSPTEKQDITTLNNDIRYIKTGHLELSKKQDLFHGSILFYSLIGLIVLLFPALIVFRKKYNLQNADTIGNKRKKAAAVAKKHLKTAEKYLTENNSDKFYDEILKAMYGYFSDTYTIALSETNKEKIKHILSEKGIADELSVSFIKLLNDCEFARYAPSLASPKKEIYDSAINCITQIEELKKWEI